jgi:hypothetical protein
MIGCVTAVKLREWRGVKPVAGPAGVAITTRLQTTPEDERVLDLVAEHVGGLWRADLAAVSRRQLLDPAIEGEARRQAGNDAQYRSARDAQHRHLIGLRAAIATIEKRLAAPTGDTLTAAQRRACRKSKLPKGYATQSERFQKQRRLQRLRATRGRV